MNVSSEERAMNVAVSEITTLWVSNGNRLRETHPFLKQKTKQESPGEEKQGRDVNRGRTCAPPPFGQQMLVSALGSHGRVKALHFCTAASIPK